MSKPGSEDSYGSNVGVVRFPTCCPSLVTLQLCPLRGAARHLMWDVMPSCSFASQQVSVN